MPLTHFSRPDTRPTRSRASALSLTPARPIERLRSSKTRLMLEGIVYWLVCRGLGLRKLRRRLQRRRRWRWRPWASRLLCLRRLVRPRLVRLCWWHLLLLVLWKQLWHLLHVNESVLSAQALVRRIEGAVTPLFRCSHHMQLDHHAWNCSWKNVTCTLREREKKNTHGDG